MLRRPSAWWAAAALCLALPVKAAGHAALLLALQPLAGHAAAGERPALVGWPVTADLAHVLAAGARVGALPFLAVLLARGRSAAGAPALDPVEFPIDRGGYVRARWRPGEAAGWDDLDRLTDMVRALAAEPQKAPPADPHVHWMLDFSLRRRVKHRIEGRLAGKPGARSGRPAPEASQTETR